MNLKPIIDIRSMTPKELLALIDYFPSTKNIGLKIVDYSDNFDSVTMCIPHNEQTKNIMGITFGGTLYSATDGMYVTMLLYRLGTEYIAMDKHSTIDYLRPGLSDLTATFHLPDSEVKEIIDVLEKERSTIRDYFIEIVDSKQKVICRIHKQIYIRKQKKTEKKTAIQSQ